MARYGVRLLAEVEMPGERVLRQVDEQETGEHEERAALPIAQDCVRDEVREGHAQHEPRRERDEQLQRAGTPRAPRGDGGGSGHIGRGGD